MIRNITHLISDLWIVDKGVRYHLSRFDPSNNDGAATSDSKVLRFKDWYWTLILDDSILCDYLTQAYPGYRTNSRSPRGIYIAIQEIFIILYSKFLNNSVSLIYVITQIY